MCIIIVKSKKGQTIPTAHFKNALRSNPDGVGLMYYQKGKLTIYRQLTPSLRDILALVSTLDEYAIHFRLATHGDINAANLHPFTFAKNAKALMHNGILPEATALSENHKITDTEGYIKKYLSNQKVIDWDKVSAHIKSYNKFVVAEDRTLKIINKDAGVEYEGNWYSNAGAFTMAELDDIYERVDYRTTKLYSPGFYDKSRTNRKPNAIKITEFYTSLAQVLEEFTGLDTEFYSDEDLLNLVAHCLGHENALDCLGYDVDFDDVYSNQAYNYL